MQIFFFLTALVSLYQIPTDLTAKAMICRRHDVLAVMVEECIGVSGFMSVICPGMCAGVRGFM